ncbi:ABC-F family ATP-binding cassette domain-containing protein [Massilibacterium senegalense]|uniref:ABC-F family ATP-binding cassette domain-containing protein n=1 Tax=Massilibacterium senegalense TaxID=1632858 RepID=UPI000783E4B9|nr:ABC-F family ATP-binding cassette domain-containing protein [Massilibacterium senegalense]
MKIYKAENITKTYGDKTLFRDISFTINEKEHIGLIGVNGTGKSSLLKIIATIDLPDMGDFSHPSDYMIRYLPQEPILDENITVLDAVFESDAKMIKIMKEYESALLDLEQDPMNEMIQKKVLTLQNEMDHEQAWDANANAKTILAKLGLYHFKQKIGELSGGQKKRVALAQVLIETPDLLLLDEPTNHLDYETIKWLEDYLSKYQGALLVVTHDRYFLDQVSTRIFELDGGKLYTYIGNYQAFIEAKAIREEEEVQTAQKRRNLYRQELAWMRRGAKARTTKQKARIGRFEELAEKVGNATKKETLEMNLSGSRLGKQVVELKDASLQLEQHVILHHFDFLIKQKDRIGIVGRNGSGKSTLLNVLAGKIQLDTGECITGQTVKIGYYTQENVDMNENLRMIEYIREAAEVVTTGDGSTASAAQMLERFLFPMHTHGTPIYKLSGGEKRRLFLLRLLMMKPNVLLLDEPTNDLDTETLTVLEAYLEDFSGVVITVSHDRYFLDKVANQLLILQGAGEIETYVGKYTDYLELEVEKNRLLQEEKEEKQKPVQQVETKKKKMTYMEKKEWEEIDDIIASVEEKMEQINEDILQTGSDFEKAQAFLEQQQQLNEQLEQLMERWEYLAELAEG